MVARRASFPDWSVGDRCLTPDAAQCVVRLRGLGHQTLMFSGASTDNDGDEGDDSLTSEDWVEGLRSEIGRLRREAGVRPEGRRGLGYRIASWGLWTRLSSSLGSRRGPKARAVAVHGSSGGTVRGASCRGLDPGFTRWAFVCRGQTVGREILGLVSDRAGVFCFVRRRSCRAFFSGQGACRGGAGGGETSSSQSVMDTVWIFSCAERRALGVCEGSENP